MNLKALRDELPSPEHLLVVAGKAVAVIVAAWLVYLVLRRAIRAAAGAADARVREESQRQRVRTLLLLLNSVVKYALVFVAGIWVLRLLALDPTPILAGAGIAGLAVGFGAQNLVRDVVSGFFIIMEGQYAVGDLVEINGVFGQVEEVGLRITRLRDPSGEIRYFPNGSISTANNYVERCIPYVVSVPFAEEVPADPAALVGGVLEDFEREFQAFARPPVLGPVERLPTYAAVLRAEVRAIPGRQSLIEQKLPGRLAAALERAGHPLPAGTDIGLALRPPKP